MKQSKLIFIILIWSLALLSGCGKKANDEIDLGSVTDSIYRNEYFGFSVALPPDWNIQDQDTIQENSNRGQKMLAGDDKNLEATLKAAEMTTFTLFAALKHPFGAPVQYNPNISCIAERVSHLPGIKKGQDYLFHSKKLLESSQLQIHFPSEISTESLGGMDFGVMHTEIPITGMTVRQKYYAAIIKGYSLGFVVSFTNDSEKSLLQDILETITFN